MSLSIAYLRHILDDLFLSLDINTIEDGKDSLCDAWIDEMKHDDERCQDLAFEILEISKNPTYCNPDGKNNCEKHRWQNRKHNQIFVD
jgi:hypothetical protein